jgi:hypothetical protein
MHAGDLRLKYDILTIDTIIAGIEQEYQGCNSSYPADIYAPGKTGGTAGWGGAKLWEVRGIYEGGMIYRVKGFMNWAIIFIQTNGTRMTLMTRIFTDLRQ